MTDPTIIELLHALEDSSGRLTAEAVVQEATSVASPLHGYFEWDDTVAAQAHRLNQARALIRVVVKYSGPENTRTLQRVFVSLSSDRTQEGGGYRDLDSVMSVEAYRNTLLFDALQQMEYFTARFKSLTQLAGVFREMDAVRARNFAIPSSAKSSPRRGQETKKGG